MVWKDVLNSIRNNRKVSREVTPFLADNVALSNWRLSNFDFCFERKNVSLTFLLKGFYSNTEFYLSLLLNIIMFLAYNLPMLRIFLLEPFVSFYTSLKLIISCASISTLLNLWLWLYCINVLLDFYCLFLCYLSVCLSVYLYFCLFVSFYTYVFVHLSFVLLSVYLFVFFACLLVMTFLPSVKPKDLRCVGKDE